MRCRGYTAEEGGEAGATEVMRTSCGLGCMSGTRAVQALYFSEEGGEAGGEAGVTEGMRTSCRLKA